MGTRSNDLGQEIAEWAEALVLLTATPLNLGNQDLFNLLRLLAPEDFQDSRVFLRILEPNRVINRVASSLLDRHVNNETRLRWLDELQTAPFGLSVIKRPEYRELETLLRGTSLDAEGVVEARRLLARLHTLSSIISRTRKVDVHEHRAVREAVRVDVEWTDSEKRFYEQFVAWRVERARRRGVPFGLATQMDVRLASSCLPAAKEKVLECARAQVWQAEDDLAWIHRESACLNR
jgi:hypothetical protein